jgi:sn-glycerol 3-phosphate transport system permease protein
VTLLIDETSPLSAVALMTRPRRRAWARWLPAAALLAPSLVFLLAFTYWPVMRVVIESFVVGRFADHAFGLGNYRRLLADPHFARAAWNNIAYAIGTIRASASP